MDQRFKDIVRTEQWSHLNILFDVFADWIFYLLENMSCKDFQLAVCIFWFTWFNKNLISHENMGLEIHETLTRIKLFLKNYHLSHSVYQIHAQSTSLFWIPPPPDFVKINCDGAWTSDNSTAGLGIICRDHNQLVIASKSVSLSNIGSCVETEGLAVQTGIQMAKEFQWERVILETDNTRVTEIHCFGPKQDHMEPWIQFCIKELSAVADALCY